MDFATPKFFDLKFTLKIFGVAKSSVIQRLTFL